MSLGSHESSSRIYLSVGFGKLRQKSLENKEKVSATTVGAVKRLSEAGVESWALEHDYVSGIIEHIEYKENDAKFGNSFEVVIRDGIDKYQLSFKEDSRFWFDFMKKLPNIQISNQLKITAYDFLDKSTGKRKAGVSVEQLGNKIASFYDKKDDKGVWTILHGFPESKGVEWKDKDDTKIYLIKVKKFLKTEFESRIKPLFKENAQHEAVADLIEEPPFEATDDLPF